MVCYAEESQLLDVGVVVNTASESHLQSLSSAFSSLMLSSYDVTVPPDFLLLSAQAMRHLQSCERSNVVYGLAKGLGEIRQDHSDSRFPARRMPMGLIEYAVGFFNADVIQHVSI